MHILVADESATSREGAVAALRAAGHEVFEAASGAQAWALSRRTRLRVAFVSLSLPELDGLELVSLWRRHAAADGIFPVVMLADPAEAAALRAWTGLLGDAAPGFEVLTRPFSPALLPDVALAASAPALIPVSGEVGRSA